MRIGGLFIGILAATACSSPSTPRQLPTPPAPPPPPPDASSADATVTAPSPGARGDACSDERVCAAGLECTSLAGGYCAAACALGCSDHDGMCVATSRHAIGELCMKKCTSDRECRIDEGYVCDPVWRACSLPNFAAIVPAGCPGTGQQDATFAASEPYTPPAPRAFTCPEGDDCVGAPIVAGAYTLVGTREGGLRVNGTTALVGTLGDAQVGADRRLHVIALQGSDLGAFGSAHHRVEYTVSSDSAATFARPVTVSGHEEMLPFAFARPALAVDTQRKWLYVAYVRGGRDARWEIVLATSRDGATWTRRKLAGDGCAIHLAPKLAIDPRTGTLHVAYYSSAGPGAFVHASCAAGGLKCKVHGAINTVPFAELSLVRNSPRSLDGGEQSLTFDAKTRLLRAVWTQVVDEAGTKVSRSFHSSAKLK